MDEEDQSQISAGAGDKEPERSARDPDPKTAPTATKSTLETILVQLISSAAGIDKSELANLQEKLTAFDDLRLQTVKLLTGLLRKGLDNLHMDPDTDKETVMKNVLLVIEVISNAVNAAAAATTESVEGEPAPDPNPDRLQQQHQEFKKQFSDLWGQVMAWQPKPLTIHKRIVTLLPDQVMPLLTKPLHMSDYLLSAFDLEGAGPMPLLALHGIFTLMLRHNFEVPDFYTRLYSLFTPAIFQPRYKRRFFGSAALFLSSTHLPEALVGAFVKRLAKLALLAPTPTLPLVFGFITNLMIQHPGLKTLVDKQDGGSAPEEDPFLDEEPDPLRSRAMESCLWEIKSLQHHALVSVAKKARFINKQLPKLEKDLGEVIGLGYEELFRREMGRRRKHSDTLDLDAMRNDLDPSTTSTSTSIGIKCSRLKGRPCLLEPGLSSILVDSIKTV